LDGADLGCVARQTQSDFRSVSLKSMETRSQSLVEKNSAVIIASASYQQHINV
jgi:hypothetical protein